MKPLFSILILAIALLSGCQPQIRDTNPGETYSASVARIIIARASHTDGDDSAWMARITKQFELEINTMHVLAAGVYSVSVSGVRSEQHINEILTALNRRDDVDYAQRDERFRNP